MERSYYDILGVKPGASLGEIKKAFRLLVKLHHPDKCGGADVADSKTKYLQVKHAFETLSDSRARQDYDNWLRTREEDRQKESCAADGGNLAERTRAADAAVRCLFANSFFSGEDTKCQDGQEKFGRSGLRRTGVHSFDVTQEHLDGEVRTQQRETAVNMELFQRLNISNEHPSHSDGFEQWLRTRPATSLTVVNDETILRTQGAVVTARDEVTHHHYTWPVTAFVRKAGEDRVRREAEFDDVPTEEKRRLRIGARGGRRRSLRVNDPPPVTWSDKVDETAGTFVEERVLLMKVSLKKELQWGDVLVRILHAPVLPYDCVLLREGLDVLAAAAVPPYGNDETCCFATTSAPSFVTPVNSSEPKETADLFLGTSCVAQVTEVGRGVKQLKKGDIVLPLAASDGCWRAAAVWQERRLMALPRDLLPRLEQAAVAKQLFLAYHLLQEYAQDLRPGDAVLLYGSGGLVSQLLVQFCRLLGFRSFFVRRGQHQKDATALSVKDYFKSLGASEVFDEDEDVAAQLTKVRQSLPLLAIELNHGKQICRTIQWLVKGGKVVLAYEAEACTLPAGLGAPSLPILLSWGTRVESFYLNGWLESRKNQQKMLKALECIGALLRAGKLIVNLTEVHELSEFTVKAALLSVRQPWSGDALHQQPLLTFASLEAEKLAFEEKQKVNVLREQEARELQESLFSQRDRALSAACALRRGDETPFCPHAHDQSVELPPTEKQRSVETPLCFFVHDRGETVEELLIMVRRYKRNVGETFQNAAFLFPAAPFACHDDPADVASWTGQHVQTLFAPTDGKKHFEHRLSSTLKGTVTISPSEIEALKDLEARCACFCLRHDTQSRGMCCSAGSWDSQKYIARKGSCNAAADGDTGRCPLTESNTLHEGENLAQCYDGCSCEYLADVIEKKAGVSGERARNIVLCGVGEGGLIALLTALTKLQFRVEAIVCIGMPLLDAHILSFLLSKTNKEAQKAKLFFLCGSRDSCCPAWCQEALRKFFSDAGYCATKEVILDGGAETDERTLAHLAAVFSILKLA